jgi:uncharacterized protein (TIGR03437 family)
VFFRTRVPKRPLPAWYDSRMLRHLALIAAVVALSSAPASAQLPDQTSLNGVYNVRYLGVNTDPADTAVSFSGTLTFDGRGGFTVAGQGTTAGATLRFRTSGTYTVLSSGMLLMDNVFDSVAANQTQLYGGLGANGVVIASSTDTFYCDTLVAIPAATTASASTLNGTYRVAHLEFLAGDILAGTRNAFFTMTSNGTGALGNVNIQGTAQALRHAATTQTSTAATYTVTANGTGTLVFPAPTGVSAANTLVSGNKIMYVSADGSFFVAGSATGYDLEIGMRPGTTPLNGLYWSAYLRNWQGSSDSQQNGIDSGQGSSNLNAAAGNLEIGHNRINIDGFFSYDSTYSDDFTFDSSGVATYNSSVYAVGAGGTIAIGSGLGPNYQIAVYVKAPTMTAPAGSTVFLNPQGVVNAANFAPITTQVAPGEMITLIGSGMGPAAIASASALPFPTTLGGVRVLMNWGSNAAVPIPLVYVSATQISGIVPYNTPTNGAFLTVRVEFNGATSNAVLVYSGPSSPGIFMAPTATSPTAGAIQRFPDYSLITSTNRARAGDTLILYMSGLGATTPAATAGVAPTATSSVVRRVDVYIDGELQAPVDFKGLTGFGGFYQMNIRVPNGLSAGEHTVEVTTYLDDGATPDSDSFQATIFVQ